MTVSEEEIKTRSLIFLFCMLGGMLLTPLSLWLFTLLAGGLEAMGWMPADWVTNLLGFLFAILPVTLLIQVGRGFLHRRYPDSPARTIPPPER